MTTPDKFNLVDESLANEPLTQASAIVHENSDRAVATLMGWLANAKKLLDGGKLDGLATARIGELVLNACRFLSEREEAANKAADQAKRQAESKVRTAEWAARHAAILRMTLNSK